MTLTSAKDKMIDQPSPSSKNSNISVRVATMDDVKHARKIVSIINSAYKTDEGWTSNKNIIKGDRVTLQDVEAYLRRSDGISSAFMCAFEKQLTDPFSDSNGEAEETVVGTVMIDTTSNSNGRYCTYEVMAVNPSYQSKGVGARIAYAAIAQAKKMGYDAGFIKVFKEKTKLRSWYRSELNFKEVGIVEYPNPQRLKDESAVYVLMKVDLKPTSVL